MKRGFSFSESTTKFITPSRGPRYFYGPLVSSNIKFVTASSLTAPEYFQNRWRHKFRRSIRGYVYTHTYIRTRIDRRTHINILKTKISPVLSHTQRHPKLINYRQIYLCRVYIRVYLHPVCFYMLSAYLANKNSTRIRAIRIQT